MEELANTSEAVISLVSVLVVGVVLLLIKLVKAVTSSDLGRTFVRALAADLEHQDDGRVKARPHSDGEAMVKAMAAEVCEELDPKFEVLRDGLAAVRAEQGAALEREQLRSKRIDRIYERVAHIEGRLGITRDEDADESEDAPVPREAAKC